MLKILIKLAEINIKYYKYCYSVQNYDYQNQVSKFCLIKAVCINLTSFLFYLYMPQ